MSKKIRKNAKKIGKRIDRVRQLIAEIDIACPGTLLKRFNTCGKPNCRCARNPNARHGPYFTWSRRERGRLVQSIVSPWQAKQLKRAIKNHRKVLDLLAEWGRESARVILAEDEVDDDPE